MLARDNNYEKYYLSCQYPSQKYLLIVEKVLETRLDIGSL